MPERDDEKKTEERTGEPFAKRWSRLKREADAETAPAQAKLSGAAPAEAAENPEGDAPAAIDPADLPDIESLTGDSDFSVFMQEGVPEELKKLALRKLWMSNPIFSSLDGLNDYDDDYSAIGIVAQKVQTAWQAGKGYVDEVEELLDEGGEDGEREEVGDGEDDGDDAAAAVEDASGEEDAPQPDVASDEGSGARASSVRVGNEPDDA